MEPKHISGLDQAPKSLVIAVFGPDIIVVITYLALCWLCFSVFIDSHCSQELDRHENTSVSGRLIFWGLTAILIVLQALVLILYAYDLIKPATILNQLQIIELLFPTLVILYLLYQQCKYTGRP